MAVFRILKGGQRYAADLQTVIGLGSSTKWRFCTGKHAGPASLGLRSGVEIEASSTKESDKSPNRGESNQTARKTRTVKVEDDPDHFGHLRGAAFVEPSRLLKGKFTIKNKEDKRTQSSNEEANKQTQHSGPRSKLNTGRKTRTKVQDDPDHFGSLKGAFIEPPRQEKGKLAIRHKDDKRIVHSQQNSESNITPAPQVQNSTDEPDEGDTFGSLGPRLRTEPEDLPTDDEGDKREEEFRDRIRPKPWQTVESFTAEMRTHIREKRLGDALALFKEMKQTYIIKPDAYMLNVLIGGCGRAGYTKLAFKIYGEMRDRTLEPDGSTYTGLFNACANSPYPEGGLKSAHQLYTKLTEKGVSLNAKTYHAAIKAFGRHGDLQKAFQLVDEMVEKGVGVTTETFNFLLSGCASDRSSGFLHAITVWKKMKSKSIWPDSYSYDLLLRVVRDCGMGDPDVAHKLLFDGEIYHDPEVKRLEMPADPSKNLIPATTFDPSIPALQMPDILSRTSSSAGVVALQSAETAPERLMMLGGIHGIVRRMDEDRVRPWIKTFTELLEIIPSEEKEEELLLEIMSKKKVRPDVDFFNILIKKRNKRRDFDSAKNVLQLIGKNALHVDIATFGTLAMGCDHRSDAQQLLQDMKDAGFRPNIQIMGSLARNACRSKKFFYLIEVLKTIQAEEIAADTKLLDELEACIEKTKKYIVDKEREGIQLDEYFITSFRTFMMYYKTWLQQMEIDLPPHPWAAHGRTLNAPNK